MAGSGSVSKRKSSKKKSDKASSKRKKDKKKESKKRRYADEELFSSDTSSSSDYRRRSKKSKKLRRRDHSASSYSSISDSESLSSHDIDHKSRKRKRLEISSKSKAPKRYTSPDSDTDAHRVKKRKRSSKDHIKPKKKSLKRKPKKYSSSSSSSDDSAAEGRRRRSKMELHEEVETQIDKKSHKGLRKNKIRSPRRSSLSISDNHSVDVGYIDEAIAPVNNSRRLKSVITIVSHSLEEIDTWENDPNKEEIVYDHDDYPSPRSMDSNEGHKSESNKHSQDASDDRMVVEHAAASEEITELGKSGTNGSNKNKEGKPQPGGAHTDNFEKGKQTEDDLELILRQKALENLRKFRVGPRNARNLNEKEAKGSSSITADSIQEKSTEHDIPTTQEVNQTSALALTSDLSRKMDVKKQTEGEPFEKEPKTAKRVATQSPDGTTLTESSKEDPTSSSKAVLAEAISRSDVSLGVEDTNPGKSSITEPTPSDKLISEEHILEKPQSETNDSSEFEQKTMSVMRGGEMVQVSYKVYIPKRAPGLARRQLRR